MRLVYNLIRITTALMLVFAASTAPAHHSALAYDQDAEITIEGTVTRYAWTNPHVYLFVREETDEGEAVVWQIEAFAPTTMRQRGWSRDTLTQGDHVVVIARPGREPKSNIAWLASIEKSDVVLFDRGDPAASSSNDVAASSAKSNSLSGTWETTGGPAVVQLLYQPRSLPLTEKGVASIENYRSKTMNPGIDCIPFTAPLYLVLPGFKNIEIGDDVVFIRGEDSAVERVVHMNLASHDGTVETIQGHSIGSWDGDVLVVDTRHFASHRLGIGADLGSSTEKHLVERFQLNPDGSGLTYSFELEDSEYLTAPVTSSSRWIYRPDVEFSPTECDLDSARRFLGD